MAGAEGGDVCPLPPAAETPGPWVGLPEGPADEELQDIFRHSRTVAVVGLSDRPDRPSHAVAAYLQAQGYRIIPVNPRVQRVLGEQAYPDLDGVPGAVDVVDVFRRPSEVPAVVEAAIRKGVPVLWLQEGVVHPEAAQRAREAGLRVVMDRCMMKEHHRLRQAGLLDDPSR